MTKLAKGALVKLNNKTCFTTTQGGGRRFPLTNYRDDENGIVSIGRPMTREETDGWYDSEDSKGMTDAGETKLPPLCTYWDMQRGRHYQVLRARCRAQLGYGKPRSGMALVLCTHTGQQGYVKRELLEVV